MTNTDGDIGGRIEEMRHARKMTQAQLAGAIGVRSQQVYRWEGGKQEVPLHRLREIAYALQCTERDLLEPVGSPIPRRLPDDSPDAQERLRLIQQQQAAGYPKSPHGAAEGDDDGPL
jgi:transcriptional regulator with XRE-family HTH domain